MKVILFSVTLSQKFRYSIFCESIAENLLINEKWCHCLEKNCGWVFVYWANGPDQIFHCPFLVSFTAKKGNTECKSISVVASLN